MCFTLSMATVIYFCSGSQKTLPFDSRYKFDSLILLPSITGENRHPGSTGLGCTNMYASTFPPQSWGCLTGGRTLHHTQSGKVGLYFSFLITMGSKRSSVYLKLGDMCSPLILYHISCNERNASWWFKAKCHITTWSPNNWTKHTRRLRYVFPQVCVLHCALWDTLHLKKRVLM